MNSHMLEHLLTPFAPFRTDPRVTNIMVNQPGEITVERDGEWFWYDEPSLTYDRLDVIGILCAFGTNQNLSVRKPEVNTILPTGERLKVSRPPATENGVITLSIRVARLTNPTLAQLTELQMFEHFPGLPAVLHQAVLDKKTIMISGATHSGKTTLARALIDIIPLIERLATIEDSPEWSKIPHRNRIARFYSDGDQSAARLTAEILLKGVLRERPDRILFQELRDEAAFSYMRALLAGHPGGITTIHAGSAKGAFKAIKPMIRKHPAGAALSDEDIREMLDFIDIVVHCDHRDKKWRVTDVYPESLRETLPVAA